MWLLGGSPVRHSLETLREPSSSDPLSRVALALRETASAVYSWTGSSEETTVDPAPNSNLPDPFTVANPTLSNGGSQIAIVGATVDDGATAGASIQFASPGLAPPRTGDVELTLNFSNTTDAGQHTGGIFTLTATNI